MPRLPKSEDCDKYKCRKHEFIMKPLKKSMLHFTKAQKAKFCPQYNRETKRFQNSIPTLLNDNKQYTPLFILQDQKKFYTENDDRIKVAHHKKIQQFSQKSEMLIPRHVRKRQFCSVCKVQYQQYLDHIESQSHKQNLRKSKYNQYITDLQRLINPVKFQKSLISLIPNIDQFESDFQKILSQQQRTR